MDKDIQKIPKNADTDIVIRVDDFGGKRGITIREFVRGERYTGFTKAGTRIPVEHFKAFKEAINSINEKEIMEGIVEITSGERKMGDVGSAGVFGTGKQKMLGQEDAGIKEDKGKGKGKAKLVKEDSEEIGEEEI